MTTQAVGSSVHGSAGNHYIATATDLTWGDLVDANSLDIGETLAGQRLTGAVAFYNAGCAAFRIYSPISKIVKVIWFGKITTEQTAVEFERPVQIEKEDKIQVYPSAVTT